jgi:Rad3-related DNA helicase
MELKTMKKALACNPMPEYWPGQMLTVSTIYRAYLDGYKIAALDAGVGTGKTIMAATLARAFGDSHIITTQKKLQEQYLSLGEEFKRITGRGNHVCRATSSVMCDKGYCITGPEDFKCAMRPQNSGRFHAYGEKYWSSFDISEHCNYWQNVADGVNAPNTVFNYAYYSLKMNNPHNDIPRATFQVLDEGHNAEAAVRGVCAFELRDRSLYHVQYMPGIDTDDDERFIKVERQLANKEDAISWLEELRNFIDMRLADCEMARGLGNKNIHKRITSLDSLKGRISDLVNRYNEDPDNWVFEKYMNGFKFSPLLVGDYFHEIITRHADYQLIMSATLPPEDVLCDRLAIDPDEIFYYTMPSPFDPDLAPIYSYPQPTMTYSPDMTNKRNRMGGSIAALMKAYSEERGLILCNSHKEIEFYEEYLDNKFPEQALRLTVHRKGDAFEDIVEDHMAKPNSVLISASAWEGLDLKDEAGRFCGIAKVPYPDMRDPVIKGLMEIDKNRYFEDTIQKIRQGVGRVVRSSEDWGDIHILDGAFRKLFLYNQKSFPEQFIERVENI